MANNASFSWDNYHGTPVIGIIRGLSENIIYELADLYEKAGFTTLEITMNTPRAMEIISNLRERFPLLNIGAGTVCTMEDLENANAAGAQFIVTPILNEEVIKYCVKLDKPIFPGAYSPTEIYRAWTLGASAVKVFPATLLGVKYMKDVLAPLNKIKLIPTGGVSLQNIRSFFVAGAYGVGMGSSMFDKKMVQDKNFKAIKSHFIEIKKELKGFNKGSFIPIINGK